MCNFATNDQWSSLRIGDDDLLTPLLYLTKSDDGAKYH